jgi:Bacterial DNA polymerase III alpha NTPase domain
MHLDKFDNPIFTEADVFNAIYAGNTSILTASTLTVKPSEDITKLHNLSDINFNAYDAIIEELDISEYDQVMQSNWYMPSEYYTFDINAYCIAQCASSQQHERIIDEMLEFVNRGLLPLLQWLKYFVDTCLAAGIFWGVGRGSSTASYVLYLIGVHRIDSLKYDLDYKEFLR